MKKRIICLLMVLLSCLFLFACGGTPIETRQTIADESGFAQSPHKIISLYNELIKDEQFGLNNIGDILVDEYGVKADLEIPDSTYLVDVHFDKDGETCSPNDEELIPDRIVVFAVGSKGEMDALEIPETMRKMLAAFLYLSDSNTDYETALQKASDVFHNDSGNETWISCGNLDCYYDVAYMYPGTNLDSCWLRLHLKNAGSAYTPPEKGPSKTPVLGLPERFYSWSVSAQSRVNTSAQFYVADGWIYGEYMSGNGAQLVKTRTDLTDWTVLDKTTTPYFITVKDGYIYYFDCTRKNERSISKMRVSGSDKEIIVDNLNPDSRFIILDDTIYFSRDVNSNGDRKDLQHLYSCDLNGKNIREVISRPVYCWQILLDGILYQDDMDGESLHTCRLDGSDDIKLFQGPVYDPVYNGEYIYYRTANSNQDGYIICRILNDGTNKEIILGSEFGVTDYVLTDDYIFFIDKNDDYRIYRTDLDGNHLTLIVQDKYCRRIAVFGEAIIYQQMESDLKYVNSNFICNIDGSGKTEFKNYN